MSAAITCLTFKPLARGSMLGFADLQMPSGLILKGCSLLESNGRRWVNPPGRPQLDADRKAMLDDAGKIIYAVSIDFSTKAIRSRWSAEAVAAIDGYLIGIGSDPSRWPDPSHTTRHAGPHRAVRVVEVMRAWAPRVGRRTQWA